MAQTTAKTAADVVKWVETTPHHYAARDEEPGFFVLKGKRDKLRIPVAVHADTLNLIEPSREEFDTRMYRASRKGRALLRRLGR